jgi:hypothetical protein
MIAVFIELLRVYCSPFHASVIYSLNLISGNSNDNLYCAFGPTDLLAKLKADEDEVMQDARGVCKRTGSTEGAPCEYSMPKKFNNKAY